jgi:ankyrin repeat protein
MDNLFTNIRRGNEGEVIRLLDADPSLVDGTDVYDNTPLIVAVKDGPLGMVKLLVQRGANLSAVTDVGMTPLHHATYRGHEEMATFLLEQGAPNIRVHHCISAPLSLACELGRLGMVRLFLQHMGPQALLQGDEGGVTPLHSAAMYNNLQLAAFLLEQGAQANSKDANDTTPFMLACGRNRLGVARLLLQHAGPQALQEKDCEGSTPLHWTAIGGHEDTATFLLKVRQQWSMT